MGERAGRAARGAAAVGRDPRSPVRPRCSTAHAAAGFRARATAPATAIPASTTGSAALLARDLGAARLPPPRSLAPLFGQHGGLGALRVAAAALDAARGGARRLVHGIARGGCRTALIVGALDPGRRAGP